jgi:hypothetical protein
VLIFDPTGSPSLTVRVVPAGTTTGCGSGAAVCAGELIAFPPAAFDGAAIFWLLEFEAVSAGLLEQATSVNNRKMDSTYSTRERIILSSEIRLVAAKTVVETGSACNATGRFDDQARTLCSTPSVR